MQKITVWPLIVLLVLAVLPISGSTQAQDTPTYERVTIMAEDDLELVGIYSGIEGLEDESGLVPAVLLMHHSSASKEKWIEFLPAFHEATYAILAIDMRGFGETEGRGEQRGTPKNHVTDTQLWIEWLREQEGIDPERISIVGASLGGDVGLNVVAQDERLVTIVTLSIGLDVADIMTAPAVAEIEQPIFLVTGFDDAPGLEAVQALILETQGEMQIRIFDTSLCCTFLLGFQYGLLEDVIDWLDTHNR